MLALARKIVQGAVARGLLLDGQVLAAAASSQKPGLIAGRYVGKDAPVMIIRCQSGFPAVGEVLSPSPFPTCGGLDAGLPSRPADARGL
jgi:fructose 1,6-bisphosphate aldolase/phosphatase